MSEGDPSVISRTSLFHGRRLSVEQFTVRLDDGREAQREILVHPGACAVVAVEEDETVYLVRQYRPAAGGTLLEIPAGTLEPGESARQSAERELDEEVGRRAENWVELGCVYVSPGVSTETITLFLARQLTAGGLTPDDDEELEVVRVPMREALDHVRSGAIRDAKTVTGLLLAFRHLS